MDIYAFSLQLTSHIKTSSVFDSECDFRHSPLVGDANPLRPNRWDLLTQGADFDCTRENWLRSLRRAGVPTDKRKLLNIVFALVLHSQDDKHITAAFIVVADGVAKRAKFHLHIVLIQPIWHGLMDTCSRGQAAYFRDDRGFCFLPCLWTFALQKFT